MLSRRTGFQPAAPLPALVVVSWAVLAAMSPCLSDNTIAVIIDGRLDRAGRSRVDQHIAECSACRSLVAALAPAADSQAPSSTGPPGVAILTPMVGPSSMVGRHIGPLRIERLIGKGAMGAVYEAVHEDIGQRVAVKVLRPEMSEDPEMSARFRNEARAIGIVHHPGLVGVLDFRQMEDGEACIVMEYLEGETLRDRLQARQRLDLPSTLRLGQQIAVALAAAHEKNIIHRDLKPANVMIVGDPAVPGGERTKILDFGIAKLAPGGGLSSPGAEAGIRTRTGVMMGTAAYMAPEQSRGAREVDGRADVYALGIILYEMLAGRRPFSAANDVELLMLRMSSDPPPLLEAVPQVPERMAGLVHSMLARDPEDRPKMREVAAVLGDLMEADPAPAPWEPVVPGMLRRRRRMVILLVAGLLGCVGLGWLLYPRVPTPTPPRQEPAPAAAAPAPPRPQPPPVQPAPAAKPWRPVAGPPGPAPRPEVQTRKVTRAPRKPTDKAAPRRPAEQTDAKKSSPSLLQNRDISTDLP